MEQEKIKLTAVMKRNQERNEEVYVRRDRDGALVSIPKYTLEDTLKQGFSYANTVVEERKIDTNTAPPAAAFECPLCGFTAKSALGLTAHKRKHV